MQQKTWDKITERKQMKEKINSTKSEGVKDPAPMKEKPVPGKEAQRMDNSGKKTKT